jgi:hypothetical protein
MSSPVVRSRNVLKRNSMRFAAALLVALASFVGGPNTALAQAPQHHDQKSLACAERDFIRAWSPNGSQHFREENHEPGS